MPFSFRHRALFPGLLVCFFISGAAGLIYQVAWGKSLGLVFGHTVYAVATVLAVFMGGLAAGSAWLGRWSERRSRPIALYGWIELGVAAGGAVSLAGLAGVRALYVAAYPHVAGYGGLLLALRFFGAAIVLFLPTFLMGGTLPVLVRGLTRDSTELGKRLARLYWVNTAGAVGGTIIAGFVLLPALGLRRTVALAVALNVIAGALALLLARGESAAAQIVPAPAMDSAAQRLASSRFLLASFAIVGATAMAYEIGWTRLLATQLGSSTFAFSLMLATFLAGIVLGSLIFEWWTRRRAARLATFATTQTLTALAALAFLVFFERLPAALPPILRATHESFRGLVLAQCAVSALAMLPAAIVFGFNFPVVTLLIAGNGSSDEGAAAAVGRAYAANTLGAIVGATSVGFWLLPALGAFHLLGAAAGVNLILAAALCMAGSPRRLPAFALNAVLLFGVVGVAYSPYFYDPAVATFNTVMYWNLSDRPLTVQENARTVDVVYVADGLNSTISVGRTEDYLALRTNGKVDASNHDVTTQLLVGHIGGVAHPAPRRVLVIGFGSGMTVSTLVRYPEIERVDCVEIEPAVVRAAPWLTQLNRNVLRDPRVHIVLDDGRNFLLTTRDQYDVIISEPSNPWIAGVSTLFTREFYAAAKRRLAPGGIFVQWVQEYSLFPDDLRMVLATFLSQFSGATLWHGDDPDLLLIAPSPSPQAMLDRARTLWARPGTAEDFKTLGMSEPEGLFGFYLLSDAELRRFAAGARLNTDDLTLLEYHAPRALLVRGLENANRRELLQYQDDVLPRGFTDDQREPVLSAAVETSLALSDTDSAERFLRPLDARPSTARALILRGRTALAEGEFGRSMHAFDAALVVQPDSMEAAWGLTESYRRSGENEDARQRFAKILARDPLYAPALESAKKLASDFSRWEDAADYQKRWIAASPDANAAAFADLGTFQMRAGDLDGALRSFSAALERDPYNYRAHRNRAEIERQRKQWSTARADLEFVMHFFPDEEAAPYALLYEADRALHDDRAAAAALRFGLRMFPNDPDLRRLSPSR